MHTPLLDFKNASEGPCIIVGREPNACQFAERGVHHLYSNMSKSFFLFAGVPPAKCNSYKWQWWLQVIQTSGNDAHGKLSRNKRQWKCTWREGPKPKKRKQSLRDRGAGAKPHRSKIYGSKAQHIWEQGPRDKCAQHQG